MSPANAAHRAKSAARVTAVARRKPAAHPPVTAPRVGAMDVAAYARAPETKSAKRAHVSAPRAPCSAAMASAGNAANSATSPRNAPRPRAARQAAGPVPQSMARGPRLAYVVPGREDAWSAPSQDAAVKITSATQAQREAISQRTPGLQTVEARHGIPSGIPGTGPSGSLGVLWVKILGSWLLAATQRSVLMKDAVANRLDTPGQRRADVRGRSPTDSRPAYRSYRIAHCTRGRPRCTGCRSNPRWSCMGHTQAATS